jgi:hypothetical protein
MNAGIIPKAQLLPQIPEDLYNQFGDWLLVIAFTIAVPVKF